MLCAVKIRIMEKYLVKIEFRYSDAPETEDGSTTRNKIVTVGVYDTSLRYNLIEQLILQYHISLRYVQPLVLNYLIQET